MSFTCNIEAAREAFAERVAVAYQRTWQGFGFIGPEFSAERAQKLAEQAAQYGFPTAFTPTINIDLIDLNDPEIFKALVSPPAGIVVMAAQPNATFRYSDLAPDAGGCGDGVVGD